ncbi:hypothetical protein [Desulfovibrio sp. Huiquan2017]|uniref:hypothetical protein n=1 Tax=Desulfovibrio sp. Huiquan2017 TaxID=2816861 RepID=UPI001A93797D|nr:hypothetical protein [Desulfovibrio sp. Huiquan2017]
MTRINELLQKIEELQTELEQELRTKREGIEYTIKQRKVRFSREVKARQRVFLKKWLDYVYDSGPLIILTVPIIWGALIPCLILDVVVTIYQFLCFPIYGIPFARRRDYVIIDRQNLGYLNWLEKMNCMYCGYFNGVIAYVREVAARTEQYWCPVRHARPVKSVHGHYRTFFEYGDAKGYREGLAPARKELARKLREELLEKRK